MYSINIKTKQKLTDVSDSLYGLFFEDINRAGDGGLYAELLRNRAFDDGIIPEGCKYDSANKLITSETGWTSSFDCYEGEGVTESNDTCTFIIIVGFLDNCRPTYENKDFITLKTLPIL